MKAVDPSASSEPDSTLVSLLRPPGGRPSEFESGDELSAGRFVVERVLGKGGMGVVYAVTDRVRERTVALKTLHIADPAALNAIKREFRSLVDTQHPGLVRLHELFWEQGRCYFTMDLVPGATFLEYFSSRGSGAAPPASEEPTLPSDHPSRRRPRARSNARGVNEARLRSCLAELVDAVDFLHAQGKVHGDLKPSNVLVDDAGKLTLLDFGLVQDEGREAPFAAAAFIAGTPLYMAPELFEGTPASKESDWYAVGVMLYQALTGCDPFAEQGDALILEKREKSPPPPEELAKGVPERLAKLAMRLLCRSPAERPGASELREELGIPTAKQSPARSLRRGRLFGRDAELVLLRRAFAAQRKRRGPLLVSVTGTSGVGKSALLEEFTNELRGAAVNVLFGRCHEREWVPHKAFDEIVEALARHLGTLGAAERDALLPLDSAALTGIFPVLLELVRGTERASMTQLSNPRELRRRAYQSLSLLLSTVARREPCVLVIDDLHWGDADSARLLLDLLGGGEAPECLIVASYRKEERARSACLEQLFSGDRRLDELVEHWELPVNALSERDARALAASLLGAEADRGEERLQAVCREAQGNPLLLHELSNHAARSTAGELLDLGQVVQARLEQLTPDARRLFELVCVSGRPLSPAIAARALSGSDLVGDAVTSLHGQRLVRERVRHRPDAVDVFHETIRHAVLSALPAEELRERHFALATAYEAANAPEAEAMAHHYASAGESEKASEWAERAASESTVAVALNRAAEFYRLAHDHCREPRRKAELRVKLARALSDAGRGGEAALAFLEAAAEAPASEALELRRHAAEQFLVSGRTSEGLDVLARVLAEVGLKLPRTPRRALWDLVLTRARLSLRGLSFEPRPAHAIDPKRLLRADACKASWALSFVNTIQGAAFQARFLQEALKSGEPCRIALGLGMEALYRSTEGQAREPRVRELQAAASALARQLDDPHVRAFEHLVRGQSSYLFGRWREAAESLEQTERILVERCKNVTWELNSSRFFWGNSLVHLGRWRELEQRLALWSQDAVDRGDLYAEASLNLIRARTLILAGDNPERAEQQVNASLAMWKSSEFGVLEFLAELSRTQIYLYCGDTEGALGIVERIWPKFERSLMQRIQLCRIHLYQHTAFALLSRAYDTGDRSGLARVAGYARKLESEVAPWAQAFALEIRACLQELAGDRDLANELRKSAEAALESAGMTLYAATCRARRARALGASRGNERDQSESGSEAQHLWDSAIARIREQNILRPLRLIAMMAPGED